MGENNYFEKTVLAMVVVLKKGASREEIEKLRIKPALKKPAGVDTKKYCGVLKLKEDPLIIQKKMRDEWE